MAQVGYSGRAPNRRNHSLFVGALLGLLAAACDGGAGVDERRRVFHLVNGVVGLIGNTSDLTPGIESADKQCQAAAVEQGHGGTWKAWISGRSVNAIERIADAGPWYRLDRRTLLFPSRARMTEGPLVPIDPTPATTNQFWTGTAPDGRRSGLDCNDWTTIVGATATVGRVDVAGPGWVDAEPLECGAYRALLCIEQ